MSGSLPPGLRWIGFDLDETLHRFRRASGRAAEAVFVAVERESGVAVAELGTAYGEILAAARSRHFTEAKTSREYRAERFRALLGRFGIDPSGQLDRLLGIYDSTLGEALELKPGAGEALRAARGAGLAVMIVSEGPQDAQDTTVERLGIAAEVDLVVTSAGEGVAKTEGLFGRALERAGCGSDELLYVGESPDRDIAPAAALGIACVYVGDDPLPGDSPAAKLDLAQLGELLDPHGLRRFLAAQDRDGTYRRALAELRAGRKRTHWMWFVFPQLRGLGSSPMAQTYAIASPDEARAYAAHPVLGARLRECAAALLAGTRSCAPAVLGEVDALKLRSSMTLFARSVPDEPLFGQVLDRFYGGADEATERLLGV